MNERLPSQARDAERDYPSEVIEACRRGDPRALDQVFRREAPFIERVLGRVVGPRGDLEDLLQMTLEASIRAFPAFRGEASVRTWMTRIAVRTALSHLRHPSQKRRVSLELIEGGAAPVSTSRPAEESEARRKLHLLYEHLERIEEKQRTAFVLFSVEGRSMDEVAALMGAGINATKSRVMWARRRLLARLKKDPRAKDFVDEHMGGES